MADRKKVVVQFLYLDLDTCDRCIATEKALDDVMKSLTPALGIASFEVEYNKNPDENSGDCRTVQVRLFANDSCQR